MHAAQLLLISLLPLIQAQETVLGVYIFHRHGDRTSKSYPPANLTSLGYNQVYESGSYFRNKYVSANASSQIYKVNSDIVKNSQITAQAAVDTVLENSAMGFLQGLYPPVGSESAQTLANGTTVDAPLNGYQLIPVGAVTTAASSSDSENSAWLQGSSGCANAIASSNQYFSSDDYLETLNSTAAFYTSLLPVINNTFNSSTDSYKNAYTGN